MTQRIFIAINYDDGDTITTAFNGSIEDATTYYVGNVFTSFDERERRAVSVEYA